MKKTQEIKVTLQEKGKDPGRKAVGYSPWKLALLRLYDNKLAVIGIVCFTLLVLAVILAPLLSNYDPLEMDYQQPLSPPGQDHFFGTDNLGRDIYSRVLWGGRESLRVGVLAMVIALTGGVVIGSVTTYVGGWLDSVTQRIVEMFMAFPGILMLLVVVAIMGPSLLSILFAIGVSGIPGYVRFVRGSVLSTKGQEYIVASRVVGARESRILFRHILPNMIAPILVYATLRLGGAIMMTSGLSYLGLGAPPPSPEWGAMLNVGRNFIRDAWWMSVFPGLGIFLSVLSVNLIGDGLRDALDPKTK